MSILTGLEIKRQVELGNIRISDFNEKQLNPNSYDLLLGDTCTEYENNFVDPKICNSTVTRKFETIFLYKYHPVLFHTKEKIWSNKYVPVIDGKSSLGRLFLFIHVTAGYGDIGFDGQYTLEVVCMKNIRLYAGMRIAQIRFHESVGEVTQYSGNYTGDNAVGAVASKSYKQFG